MMSVVVASVADVRTRCRTRDELHAWVNEHLGMNVPRAAVCPNHQAPFDYLWRAYDEPGGDLVVWAPRGGGKTRLGAAATLLDLRHKPQCQVRILGGSLDQSLRMWEHLEPDLLRHAEDLIDGKPKARRIALTTGAAAAILPQSQRAVRGLRVQKLRCDEVEMFDPDVWEAAQLVTRSRKSPGSPPANAGAQDFLPVRGAIEALSTFHRPFGLMQRVIDRAEAAGTPVIRWCLFEVLEHCEADRHCPTCPLWEECQGIAKKACDGFFPIDDAIAMKRRVSRETWQSEMLCRRPSARGAVFADFDEAAHVREGVEDVVGRAAAPPEVSLAIDFGYANPFVCLWVATYADRTAHVIDEYVQEGRRMAEHVATIAARPWPRARRLACDPAGSARNDQTAKSNVALLREAGYEVRCRQSHIVDGVEMVRAALAPASGRPRLFVHPRCKRLCAAMKAYHYADGGRGGEVPLKDGEHDHLVDALRYHYVNEPVPYVPPRRY